MKKLILLFGLLIISLFLVSCDSIEDIGNEINVDEVQDNIDGVNVDGQSESTGITGDCQAGWKCISESKMVYQNSDCSFGDKKDCNTVCTDNVCKPAEVCDVGFKCINNDTRGYQKEDCDWIKKETCDFGCSDGKCNPMPENYTEPVEETETVVTNTFTEENAENVSTTPDVSEFSHLSFGETVDIDGHSLAIHNIESGQVIIKIDGIKSEWLFEGDSYTIGNLKITVTEILFQGFAGGIMRIGYTVG